MPRPTCLLLIGLMLGLVPLRAQQAAAGNCLPGSAPYNTGGFAVRSTSDFNQNHLAGADRAISGLGGVMSNIKVMDPWVEPVSGRADLVTAWVMLSAAQFQWAQIGWVQYSGQGGNSQVIMQTNDNGSLTTRTFQSLAIGSVHNFMVTYKRTSAPFDLWVDGQDLYTANLSWVPTNASFSSENLTVSSQMPGQIGNPESFEGTQAWIGTPGTANGSWQPLAANSDGTDISKYWEEWGDATQDYYTADWACSIQPPGGKYKAVLPLRILDTRNGTGGFWSPIGPGSSIDVQVAGAGVGGVPNQGAMAAVLSVTVTSPGAAGDFEVYPTGISNRPLASTLNFLQGQTVSNLTQVRLGNGGKVSLFNNSQSTTHALIDVEGWYATPNTSGSDGLYNPVTPARILDTRGSRPLGPGQTYSVQMPGYGGIPSTGVSAAVFNLTETRATASSYLTVWPDANPRPTTSNVNFTANSTRAIRVVSGLGAFGVVDFYNAYGNVDILVDVVGWFTDSSGLQTSGGRFVPASTPIRIYDSRYPPPTPLGPGATFNLEVGPLNGGSPPIFGPPLMPSPTGAVLPIAVVLNITITNPTASSYLIVWATGAPMPSTSDINYVSSQTVPNLIVTNLGFYQSGVGTDFYVSLFNGGGSTDYVVDMLGFYSS